MSGERAVRAVRPVAGPLDATARVPGSKSVTNRALVCAALAPGRSVLTDALFADDTEAMLEGLRALGTRIEADRAAATVAVTGPPVPPAGEVVEIDARLSGTTARFLLPVVALGPGRYRLDGAPPLRARPMADGLAAVRSLGAEVVEGGEPGHFPVTVTGVGVGLGAGGKAEDEAGGRREVVVGGAASSQFLSGLLLSGPAWPGGLRVVTPGRLVSRPYVDMTLAVMRAFGAEVRAADATDATDVSDAGAAPVDRGSGAPDAPPAAGGWIVEPGGYHPTTYAVEPDASAASYFFAAAAICGGRVTVEGLGAGSLQGDLAFVDVLARMGCRVHKGETATTVEATGPLRGVDVDMGALSDTAQTLAAVAVFAEGPTRLRGIGFIRHKETDRVGNVVRELRRCGVDAVEEPDGFVVRPGTPHGARIETYDDHRMAMSFALLGLRTPGIEITDPGCVAKTFPGFWDALDALAGSRPRVQ
ncbi:MAG TPA: 3-phosphoshikimate 1-carboxyvinyltransferase [Acidimicrobiales bacterium]